MNKISQTIKLNSGHNIPRIGLGTWKIKNDEVEGVVINALQLGYHHLDTAKVYGNEIGVGRGIKLSHIPRKQIFVTTKLAVWDLSRPQEAFRESLARLGLDYVDLYLIHWPFIFWKRAWQGLEKIFTEGKAKSVGVSNFGIRELETMKKFSGLVPAVNQIEITPFLTRSELVNYCQSEGIVVEAYSPLARGKRINDPQIAKIAQKYHKTPAQIFLRWGLQRNLVMLPKAQNPEHLKNNFDLFTFEISPADIALLDSLNENSSALFPGWTRT
jgi:diketogulonate reductase-like aldo/keto reductase